MKTQALKSLSIFMTLISFSSLLHAATQDNQISWAGCGITKKAFMQELALAFTAKTGVAVSLQGGGATKGIRDTINNKIDIGGTCRMTLPSVEQTELHATLHPVAWDALAIIVNKKNPISNLSMAQVKDIYTGKITNWKTLNGRDAPIHLYTRRGKISGVGYAIRQYIFKDSSMIFKSHHVVKSSGPLEKACEKDINAMGITGISSARKRNVKIVKFNGMKPSYSNLKAGKYFLYRPLYLVTSPAPSKLAKDFISYASSSEGRRIIRDNGTVPYLDAPRLLTKMLVYGFGVK
ncbi:Phosphate ABC transporter, periplasmic phosphate-binding protein PstS (TC 3.A.1.7.1) [hydrothermal vent metagenome]|uniref:Phosphate ABC transporter, periplasmic phosphate-binding protein PstS (TC 3.A.1.7.1) n=1 Tax=hydrothermal vent metagenome TaxID=652676 RepID=A0A3B0ZCQ4_9ZZZZ